MHLISSLCAGMAGAANGWAELYVRDTSNRATWYSSFEGDGTDSSGANITLDAYGAKEIYVNQLVDVVVKDEDGNVVRSFTDGYASPNIEVVSPAFTGTDYVTAASAVNEPTTLQAVLNLWVTNSGSPDWEVLIDGAATTLQNAFGNLSGLIFNVKSPTYGAVGDGTTNDQSAIAAALAAAAAAGGGIVFFPKGTYRITSAIAWDNSVAMVGVGMNLSIITMDAAAQKVLRFTAANTGDIPTMVSGMGFQTAQANSTTTVELEAGAFVEFNRCGFAKTSTATGLSITVSHADARLRCIECHFNWRSATLGVYSSSVQAADILFQGCRATPLTSATFDGTVFATRGTTAFRDCVIDYSTTNPTGTSIVIDVANGVDTLSVTGCRFEGGPGTVTGIDLIASAFVTARDNFFDSVTNRYALASGVLQDGSFVETIYARIDNSDATPDITIDNDVGFYCVEFDGTNTTTPVVRPPKIFYPGQPLRVIAKNAGAGTWGTDLALFGGTTYGSLVTNAAVGDFVFLEYYAQDTNTASTFVWGLWSAKLNSPN